MFKKVSASTLLAAAVFLLLGAMPAMAGIARFIDDNDTVVLQKNTHPMARMATQTGYAETSLPLEHMIMSLQIPAAKQAALGTFLKDQHNPASAHYHQWITPEEFGAKFGPAADDIAAVSHWLTSHGFKVEEVAKSGTWINFSGDVSHVEQTFKTVIKTVQVGNRFYHANAADPSIPRGLSGIVSGIVTLHNIPRQPKHNRARVFASNDAVPNYTSGSSHYLSPGDFSAIYNLNPLYAAGVDGTGQSIAIVGRTRPSTANWSSFRSLMGLPPNPPQVIVNGPDPGDLGPDEDMEANLDVEWAGAVAKNATIKFVTSQSTYATDGIDLSAQYIVSNNIAPVMSISFGSCESDMGTSENAFFNNLWAQAAAQGITVLVSTGDSGAAGCSDPGSSSGSGPAVNGLASTPFNLAIGGTQFNEASGSYWDSVSTTSGTSARGYIPEVVWNESGNVSGGSGLWATGGGASRVYGKPAWQAVPGVPQDGRRDLPDVSLSAAGHDSYLVVSGGALGTVSGTSASAPSFAGLVALVVQKTGERQGNANVQLYQMAQRQYASGGAQVFHDVTAGNNSVPGVAGYSAAAVYDLATGLGSVDAYAMVTNWGGTVTAQPDFALAAISSLSVVAGKSGTVPLQVSVSGGFNSAVSFSVSGLPTGVTATVTPATIAAPGSGTATLSLAVGASVTPGTRTLTVTATGGGATHSQSMQLTVGAAPDFALSVTSPPAMLQGSTGSIKLDTTAGSGFNSAIALAVSALPSGVTASFAPTSIAAPGTGSSTLTLNLSSSAPLGTRYISITASAAGVSHTVQVPITIQSNLVYSSNFADRWYASAISGSKAKWTILSSGTYPTVKLHAGSLMAQLNSYTAPSGNQARIYSGTRLTLPSSAKTVTLSFWVYHDVNRPTKKDQLQAQVSGNGTTWSSVGASVSRYTGATGWAQATVDLSAYRGQNIYLGFLGSSAGGYNMYVGDVSVTLR